MAQPSSRVLGKGRVLGNTQLPATSTPAAERVRNADVLSPSASSISLTSDQGSTSKSSLDENDISHAVALSARDTAAASASSRMVCPICNEEMVTLLQLNRHLDDTHKNLEVVEQDEVKTWFKTQMVKAKKFQPLAVLNQKLKSLDVFESDEHRATPPPTGERPERATPEPARVEPEELVTREHWQRISPNNACSDPMCGKRLGGGNGNINCRKCGKLFCEEHTMYQMKLSRSAQHDPVRGQMSRVCETCYKSREGYNDHDGFERDITKSFMTVRRGALDKSFLEVSRLEKRLTKLTQLLSDPILQEDQGVVGYLWSFSGSKTQQRQLEESVVEWEDDASVLRCPFCQQEFSNYTFRRHHCRLCGRVVCADPLTQCSNNVPLDVATKAGHTEKSFNNTHTLDIRMCKMCRHTLFSKSDFLQTTTSDTPDQRAFRNLKQFERGIRVMLPRFQKLLSALQDPERPPTSSQLAEATKVRKRLTDSFTQYSIAAQRIRDLPSSSATQALLQKQIHAQASSFLHMHMLPLKSLPKMLRHASPHGSSSLALPPNDSSGTSTPDGRLSPNGGTQPRALAAALNGAEEASNSSAISSLETEEKELRERLMVLQEQRFMVGEMLADAHRRRKMEEVESLGRNLEEVDKEIARLNGEVEGLDGAVKGAYLGAGSRNIDR